MKLFILQVALLAAMCVIGIFIVNICFQVLSLNNELNRLYGIRDDPESHSGGVLVAIEIVEAQLQSKYNSLLALVSAFVSLIIVELALFRGQIRLKISQAISCVAIAVLMFVPFIPVANATMNAMVTHYYARVEMTVPSQPWLIEVCGLITPKPAEIVNGWICYHIGVVNPLTKDWLGAGYVLDKDPKIGTAFYIEWQLRGVWNEITVPGVVFGREYFVAIGLDLSRGQTWVAWICENDTGKLILLKKDVELPQKASLIAFAGGESIYPLNNMSAQFTQLTWVVFDPLFEQFIVGYWDGQTFPCTIVHDYPYGVQIQMAYSDFTVYRLKQKYGRDGSGGFRRCCRC